MAAHYDYIITGAGCAGSSLLMRMMGLSFFDNKKILVIDQSAKNTNDRTWCFWEEEADIFEPIVYHRWSQLDFFAENYSNTLQIAPYQYKMIRGIDLYQAVREKASIRANIEWKYANIHSVETQNNKAVAVLDDEKLTADFVFNSIHFTEQRSSKKEIELLQHFKGWFIKTPQPVFDPTHATFMDFRVGQGEGTTFVYVLPTSATMALVEYTLFTKDLLSQEKYEIALRDYIHSTLHIDQYEIIHEEYGIIPMTTKKFPLQRGRVVNMGVAGGQVKASSGYAFRFIQKRTRAIVEGLVKGESTFSTTSFSDKKFHLYDRVLLDVLDKKKMRGADIFTAIFRNNSPEKVLAFLDNESSLATDLDIMRSVPTSVFLPAAIRSFF